MTDEAQPPADPLVVRFRRGDPDAFRAVLDDLSPHLEARIRRRMTAALQRKVSVSDVMQETSMVAFEQRGQFAGRDAHTLREWLLGIAENKTRQAIDRHVGTAKRAVDREVTRDRRHETGAYAGCEPTPSQHAVAGELEDLAQHSFARLPADYQEVLRLTRSEGLGLAEVARRMDRSPEAVKKLRQRALFQFTEFFQRARRESHG